MNSSRSIKDFRYTRALNCLSSHSETCCSDVHVRLCHYHSRKSRKEKMISLLRLINHALFFDCLHSQWFHPIMMSDVLSHQGCRTYPGMWHVPRNEKLVSQRRLLCYAKAVTPTPTFHPVIVVIPHEPERWTVFPLWMKIPHWICNYVSGDTRTAFEWLTRCIALCLFNVIVLCEELYIPWDDLMVQERWRTVFMLMYGISSSDQTLLSTDDINASQASDIP